MQVQFGCPECGHATTVELHPKATRFDCPQCGMVITANPRAWRGEILHECAVCPGRELFVRKNFPQRAGLAIVVLGFIVSSIAWYYHAIFWTFGVLFLTALVDVLLYFLVGDVVECYNCHAIYRGVVTAETVSGFDLEVHEKFRQLRARQKSVAEKTVDRRGQAPPTANALGRHHE